MNMVIKNMNLPRNVPKNLKIFGTNVSPCHSRGVCLGRVLTEDWERGGLGEVVGAGGGAGWWNKGSRGSGGAVCCCVVCYIVLCYAVLCCV